MSGLMLTTYIISILNITILISVIFIERKKPESAIAWILTVLFLPVIGLFLYFFFGESFRFKTKKKDREKLISDKNYKKAISKQNQYFRENKNIEDPLPMLDLAILNFFNAGSILSNNNKILLLESAKEKYIILLEDIKNAKESIHISYFIFRGDLVGDVFKNLLIDKAKEGVEVRILYDKIGSRTTPKKFFKPLRKAGAKVKQFFPTRIWTRQYFNHRNHRKMVIIDGKIGYIGGINIGKEYLGMGKIREWRDTHLRLQGDSVHSIQMQFFLDYLFVSKETIDFSSSKIFNKYFPKPLETGNKLVQIVSSGPDFEKPNVRNAFLKMIFNAKKSIYIQTPYFIPDEAIEAALKIAAKSGVKVKLMIPGKPDKYSVYYITLSHIQQLLNEDIEVYFYDGFLHSKKIICDDCVVSIGSSNFDRRSFHINFEINAFVYDKEFVEENIAVFNEDLKKSQRITYEKYKKRSLRQKIKEQILRLMSPLV